MVVKISSRGKKVVGVGRAVVLGLWLTGQLAAVGCANPRVSAGDPRIRYVGRFDFESLEGPRFAWSGSTIALNFAARAIKVKMRTVTMGTSEQGEPQLNHYTVLLDGREMPVLRLRPGTHVYTVASHLAPGPHRLVLFKRTEALVGVDQFLGVELASGGVVLAPPPAKQRRLEFIGDSITAGYGNEGESAHCRFSPETENNFAAFGALTARALNADYVAIAWSGKGVWRNYGGDTVEPMPALIDRILPADPLSRWDFSRWTPDAVVVRLGGNDFSVGIPDRAAFVGAYQRLLSQVRQAYPLAHIFLAFGPTISDEHPARGARSALRSYLATMVDEAHAAGDARLHLVEFARALPGDAFGCDYHPSRQTHERMAVVLTRSIARALGWEG